MSSRIQWGTRTQAPLMADHVQFQDMVVDFVRIGIESTKRIYVIPTTVGHCRIHQASRSLAQGPNDLGSVIVLCGRFDWRIRHEKSIGRGSS